MIAFLLATGVTLLVLAHAGNATLAHARSQVMSAVEPALSFVLKPVDAVHGFLTDTKHFFATIDENRKLRAENDTLRHWQSVALELKAENEALRQVVNYAPVENVSYVTARVLSTSLGDFSQSLLLDVGTEDGVKNLQPVVDADGLIGRVVDVSKHGARVLLLSDVASRVPVVSVDGRQRALLTGTGTDMLRLGYVASDTPIKLGEAVATTEEGGLIPGGIAVGTVFRHDDSGYTIKPLRPLTRAQFVRVVQFDDGTPTP